MRAFGVCLRLPSAHMNRNREELVGTEEWRKVLNSYMDILILNLFQTAELIEPKLFVTTAKFNFLITGVLQV